MPNPRLWFIRSEFVRGPDEYLEHVRLIKDAVAIPVIASLNGVSSGGWLEYARLIDQAGADALQPPTCTEWPPLPRTGLWQSRVERLRC